MRVLITGGRGLFGRHLIGAVRQAGAECHSLVSRPSAVTEDGLVPASWELVRRDPNGDETVLAKHIVTYDVGPNGEVLYSDGLRIWQHGSPPKKLFSGKLVQSVVVV